MAPKRKISEEGAAVDEKNAKMQKSEEVTIEELKKLVDALEREKKESEVKIAELTKVVDEKDQKLSLYKGALVKLEEELDRFLLGYL